MLIFGLDLGVTSIGFAVIRHDKLTATGEILRLGARIFPEARDPDGAPLNQTRRAKRMMRRQLRRRRNRRRALNQLLAEKSLLPVFGGADWAKAMAADPYALRARALQEPLSPEELGRALYHLAKRRHFLARDLAETGAPDDAAPMDETSPAKAKAKSAKKPAKIAKSAASAEESAQAEAREKFVAEIKASGATIGALLAGRPPQHKKRGVHATRALVEAEFSQILAAQSSHHPALRDEKFIGALQEAIFFQRPVFWRKSTLGACALIPAAPLCRKSAWISQQRRMIEKINNLAFVGGNARDLDHEERAALIFALGRQKSLSWGAARKILEPLFQQRGESAKSLRFNHEIGDEKATLKGNLVDVALYESFGEAFFTHPQRDILREHLPDALWRCDYDEIGVQRVVILPEAERAQRRDKLARELIAQFGAAPAAAQKLARLHLPQGWEPYSTEALQKILPELEAGAKFGSLLMSPDYADWRALNFPARDAQSTGSWVETLPSPAEKPEAERLAQLRNPTVVRVQNELRKVVNNLLRAFGRPDVIRVELARDIGKSQREREDMQKAMRQNEARRKDARKNLIAQGLADPKDGDIEKYLLWKESGEECFYTGQTIGFADLFCDNPLYEIEHIWPRSISFDNGLRNKTLCAKSVNAAKGNRIPFEFFAGRPEEWAAAKNRIWKKVGRDGVPPGKARRFCAETMPEDFTARQLTDTSYATREALASLKRLWPDVDSDPNKYVQATSGKITAQLRRRWGLNHVLAEDGEKTRSDHRHHAIDALVVACAENFYAQRLAEFFKRDADARCGLIPPPDPAFLPKPWPTIRADAFHETEKIIVSHRVRKKISGPLHKETVYGDTGRDEKTKSGVYRLFVTRKPVERLSKTEIEDIVDERIKTIIRDWVTAHGGDPKKAFAAFPRVSENGPEIRKVRLTTKQQTELMAPSSTGFANSGSNHHVAIFRAANGKVTSQTITLFEAARRLARKDPVVQRDAGPEAQFIMSLTQGEQLIFAEGKMKGVWVVKSIWSSGQIVLWRDTDAIGDSVIRPMASSILRDGGHKISVDPIGNPHPAHD